MESPDSRDSADAAQTPDDTAANTTAMDDSAPPRRQIAVAPLIFGATILAVLVRGMTSVMTRVIAWPLFGETYSLAAAGGTVTLVLAPDVPVALRTSLAAARGR